MPEHLERALRAALASPGGEPSDASAIAATVRDMVTALAAASAQLIGDSGFRAIFTRGVHLVRHQHGWIPSSISDDLDKGLGSVRESLERQDPRAAADAAVGLLCGIAQLLNSFIGDHLTTQLLRQAWPAVFTQSRRQESQHE